MTKIMAEIKSNKSQSQTTADMAQIVTEMTSISKRQKGEQEKKRSMLVSLLNQWNPSPLNLHAWYNLDFSMLQNPP